METLQTDNTRHQKTEKRLSGEFVLCWIKSAWFKHKTISKQSSNKTLLFSTVNRPKNVFEN